MADSIKSGRGRCSETAASGMTMISPFVRDIGADPGRQARIGSTAFAGGGLKDGSGWEGRLHGGLSRQQVLDPNRKIAHPYAGRVIHGVCNGRGNSRHANLADTTRAERVQR